MYTVYTVKTTEDFLGDIYVFISLTILAYGFVKSHIVDLQWFPPKHDRFEEVKHVNTGHLSISYCKL